MDAILDLSERLHAQYTHTLRSYSYAAGNFRLQSKHRR